jgi:hypothetical protein
MKITEYFASFKSVWGGAAIAAGAGPLGLWVADLEPPWPTAVGKVATLFCAIAILIAFFVRPEASKKKRSSRGRAVGIALLVFGAVGVMGYLWAYSRYVVLDSIERAGRTEIIRIVIGSELRPGMQEEAAQTTNLDLLRDSLYEPEQVWTSDSVNSVRLILAASFVLSFVSLTAGAAVLAQAKGAASEGGSKSPTSSQA